jgi:hypothetical protein
MRGRHVGVSLVSEQARSTFENGVTAILSSSQVRRAIQELTTRF